MQSFNTGCIFPWSQFIFMLVPDETPDWSVLHCLFSMCQDETWPGRNAGGVLDKSSLAKSLAVKGVETVYTIRSIVVSMIRENKNEGHADNNKVGHLLTQPIDNIKF